jgi:predicted nuclease of predicted toxin-antitoxin system
VRLLFDENLSALSADYTRVTLGMDVLDAWAAGLAGKADFEVRQFAIQSDRILVTLDADFGSLIPVFPDGYAGCH